MNASFKVSPVDFVRTVKVNRLVAVLIALAVWAFCAGMFTLISTTIWPGQMKLTESVFCDEARPEAIVVSDTYSTGDGETTTNFTLYCMGERGDVVDIGWARPFLLVLAVNAVGMLVLLLLLVSTVKRVRASGSPPCGPEDPIAPSPISG